MQINRSVLNRGYQDLNPVSYGSEECAPNHSYGPACRDHFLIHFIVNGKGTFERFGESYQLQKGDLFLIRPEELTYYEADDTYPWKYVWIGFTGLKCEEFLQATDLASVSTLHCPKLLPAFQQIMQITDQTPSTELALCARLYEMFAVLTGESKGTRQLKSSEYVRRAKDYMDINYAQNITMANLAQLLGIDKRYFSRIFAQETGCSPKDYLTNIRMARAATLLHETCLPVSDIASSVGYDDLFHFSKMFKKKVGLAPFHYRGGKAV